MNPWPAKTRALLERVVRGRISKAQASRQLGVSRKTLYAWLPKYEATRLSPYLHTQQAKNKRKRAEQAILGIVIATPLLGPKKIAKELATLGMQLSVRSVWKSLRDFGLQKRSSRIAFATRYRLPKTAHRDVQIPKRLRFLPEVRKRMVEDVLLGGSRVVDVTRAFHVSRKTFEKWKHRYLTAQEAGEVVLSALADQNPTGSAHPRGADQATVTAVLDLVAAKPALSTHAIAAQLGTVGNHGVQGILARLGLSHVAERRAWAKFHAPEVATPPRYAVVWERVRSVWQRFLPGLAAIPPPKLNLRWLEFGARLVVSALFTGFTSFGLLVWISYLANQPPQMALGLFFATVSLTAGTLFFLYSLKYYGSLAIVLSFSQKSAEAAEVSGEIVEDDPNRQAGQRGGLLSWILGITGKKGIAAAKPVGLEPNLSYVALSRFPNVSVHIPLYNEKNVAERAIAAAINMDYPSFEVIVADDSNDETTAIIQRYQEKLGKVTQMSGEGFTQHHSGGAGFTLTTVTVRPGVVLKHLHRKDRLGFKGAALALALKYTDPAAEFISVFDADFVPYPDTLTLFLKYFKVQNNMSEEYTPSNVAAVQGYQWHVLNKSENWITRGVRSEYAGSYVVERAGTELYGGLKMISGSVYMIRRKPLAEIGWGTSITEDFELTLKLYEAGYKVVYTPYIQAPAECVSTLKRMIRQRMRWAEGHSFNVKSMFWRLLLSAKLTLAEKFEMVYLSPYYLQAVLFMVGTFSWLLAETVFFARLPFWTALWGWSLVLTNMVSLPLTNAVGMFLEESERKDYVGLWSFIALTYVLVPFQAYAAVKGFLEPAEGPWFRTPKTGRITDVFTRGAFTRFIAGIFAGGRSAAPVAAFSSNLNQYLALATANNTFTAFSIQSKPRLRWLSRTILSLLLAITTTLMYSSRHVQQVYATNITTPMKLSDIAGNQAGEAWPAWGNFMVNQSAGATNSLFVFNNTCCNVTGNNFKWYSNLLPQGGGTAIIPSGTYTLNLAKELGPAASNRLNYAIQLLLTSNNGATENVILSNTTYWVNNTTGDPITADNTIFAHTIGSIASNISITSPQNRLAVRLYVFSVTHNTRTKLTWLINSTSVQAQLVPPSAIQVPEIPKKVIFFAVMVFSALIPTFVGMQKEKRGKKKKRKGWREEFEALIDRVTGRRDISLDNLPV